MNKKIHEFDFIRAFSTIGIVWFHYFGSLIEKTSYASNVTGSVNFSFGHLFVTIFFIMSGALIYRNNANVNLKTYYKKRFLSIYPSFYLVYLSVFMVNVIKCGTFFFMDCEKPLLLLSVTGLDGYMYYLGNNYYLIGEWFLGALILIYILYPALLYLIKKNCFLLFFISFAGLLLATYSDCFQIDSFRNLLTCIFSFSLGMICMHSDLFRIKTLLYSGSLIFIVLLLYKVDLDIAILSQITGTCGFFFLFLIGKIVPHFPLLNRSIQVISKRSYEVYLVHHVIISKISNNFVPGNMSAALLMFVFCLIISLIVASIVHMIVDKIIHFRKDFSK